MILRNAEEEEKEEAKKKKMLWKFTQDCLKRKDSQNLHNVLCCGIVYTTRGSRSPPQTSGGFAAEIPFFVWNPAAVITAAGFFRKKIKYTTKKGAAFAAPLR